MTDLIATTARQLGVVRTYQDLHQILRERAEELNVSRLTIDDAAGLTSGHSSKLLAPRPMRRIGAVSMGPMLGALGLALVVVEDVEAIRRIAPKLRKRHPRQARLENSSRSTAARHAKPPSMPPPSTAQILQNAMREIGRKGGEARMKKLSPKQRRQIAQQAGRARWSTVRPVRAARAS